MAELDGFEAMISALRAIPERVAGVTPTALAQAGHLVEASVKLELSRTSHPPGTPTPSPPGSPPSLISGALRRSILVEGPRQVGDAAWQVSIGPTIVYGPIQERGGVAGNGAYLPARPYMRPGLAQALPGVQQLLSHAWTDAIG